MELNDTENVHMEADACTGAIQMAEPSGEEAPHYGIQPYIHQPTVQLYVATWARESHGLFDYEARHPIKKQFSISYPATIIRKSTDVTLQTAVTNPQPDQEPLARLIIRGNKFCVDAARIGENRMKGGKLWRVVKEMANGYMLQEGDSIKLGRFKLRVRQIVLGNKEGSEAAVPQLAAVNPHLLPPRTCSSSPEDLKKMETVSCRICLLDGSTKEDPLIRPCECKGTIEYVHLGCLRHWIRGRLDLGDSNGNHGTYFYKPMACELCKAPYATHMIDDVCPDATSWPLIELPKTTPPFIVLERDSNRPESKGVHVISLAEKKLLKLGRGHESDVRFADVSISRWHATVYYDGAKESFVLTDHGSKFGTLVAMRTPVALDPSTPLSLQAGRTVLQYTLQLPGQQQPNLIPFSNLHLLNFNRDNNNTSSGAHPASTGGAGEAEDGPSSNAGDNNMQTQSAMNHGFHNVPFGGSARRMIDHFYQNTSAMIQPPQTVVSNISMSGVPGVPMNQGLPAQDSNFNSHNNFGYPIMGARNTSESTENEALLALRLSLLDSYRQGRQGSPGIVPFQSESYNNQQTGSSDAVMNEGGDS